MSLSDVFQPALIGDNAREGSAWFNLSSPSINETAMFAITQTTFNCPVQHSALYVSWKFPQSGLS
jgi:hypothetical protein